MSRPAVAGPGAARAASERPGIDRLAPVVVLVPSNLLRQHLLERLAGSGGAVNVRFHLVPDLARAIAPGLAEAPDLLDDLLLETLLAEEATAAGPFAPVRDRPGLRHALLAAFADLGEARIAPADLARALPPEGDPEHPRLAEVTRLYAAYRQALADRGLVETVDVVAEAARRAPRSALLRGAAGVLVYGFYDFTQAQLELVEGCARALPATVFFPWSDAPAFACARPVREALERLGFQPEAARASARAGAGAQLADRLFRTPRGKAAPPLGWAAAAALEIVSCPGEAREAREIARLLAARARRDPDLAFERVGVLPRTLEDYRRFLRTAGDTHGVPVHLPRPLGETAAARTLLALLGAWATDLRRQQVLELLDSAEPPAAAAGRGAGSVAAWDRISREAGVVSGQADWDRRLEAYAADAEERRRGRDAEGARALRALALDLASRIAGVPGRARPSVFAAAAARLMRSLAAGGDDRERVVETLASLARLDLAAVDVDLSRFRALVEQALARERAEGGEDTRPLARGVLAADVMAARGVPFDVVVLPGLVERSFPQPPREDFVLPDAARQAIGERLGRPGALRTARARRDEERLLFALAAASARRQLVLTFPRLEAGTARARLPSSYLLAVTEALTGARAHYQDLEGLDCFRRVQLARLHPDDPDDAESALEYDLATAALPDPGEVLHLALRSAFFERGLRLDEARWAPRLGRYDGLVGPELGERASALAGPGASLSPSRLESYAECPLRYFFRYGLDLRAVEEPERATELAPLDRGRIVHAVLFAFLTRLRREGRGLEAALRDALARDLLATADEELARHEQSGVVGSAFVWELDRQALRHDLLGWLDREMAEAASGFRPRLFEARFGPRAGSEPPSAVPAEDPASSDEPVAFDLGDGRTLRFRGRIDRIDTSADGSRFRVIDYKTGKVGAARPETIRGGRALQLPIYLLAARALLARAGLPVGAGEAQYFFASRRGGFKRVGFGSRPALAEPGEAPREREEALRGAVRAIADGIAAGRFQAEPSEELCRFCDYKPICGASRERIAERKAGDAERQGFVALREIE